MRQLLLALPALVACCAGALPEPPLGEGSVPGEQSQVVLTMPPPGRVQIVPPRPTLRNAVWIDGEWAWNGRRWVWQDHGWQSTVPDQVYALPRTTRLSDGRLIHSPGQWRATTPAANAGTRAAPPPLTGPKTAPPPL